MEVLETGQQSRGWCASICSYLRRPITTIQESSSPLWAHIIFMSIPPIMIAGGIAFTVLSFKASTDGERVVDEGLATACYVGGIWLGNLQRKIYFAPPGTAPYLEEDEIGDTV